MIEDKALARLFKVESAEHLARLDDGLLRLEKTPADRPLLEEVFRESHSLKGAARMLGLSKIEAAAHGLETILNAARRSAAPLAPEELERLTLALGDLRRLVQDELAGASAADAAPAPDQPAPAAGEPLRIETVRVETRKLDDLLTLAGELSVIEGRSQRRLALMDALLEQWSALERGRGKSPLPPREGEAPALFGARLKEARDAFCEDGARLEAAVHTLEERVHDARLLPLSAVFALFARMVRDLAKQQGKEAELEISGGDISVDKRILEEMKDPLMHLLRNAIDHGVEPPAERERLGKPRAGAVRLRAARENDRVLLEVSDDGRGLDLDAIRRAALKRGLHDEAALAAMTPAQLQQLLFLPGFSTSAFVTELSGRGVGLDVVKVNAERLKGDIRMESSPGRGTLMQVRLPLSLATTRLLLAGVGGRLYGLPIEFVRAARRVREKDLFTLEGRPAVELDGQPLIAPRLADLLALPDAGPGGATVCIVIQAGDERLGLRVDELRDEEEVVAKPLGAPLTRVRNVSGLTMLGSGEICAVLNCADLALSARRLAAVPVKSRPARPAAPAQAAILLVEDSALVRAMEKRVLEDAGYEVTAAVDGLDALEALARRAFAAVVSDIVMPNMDGLALTSRIRREARHKDLPVILVTTLGSDEDKRRGLEAGANAYIPKSSFDQRALLETLRGLIGARR